MNIRVAPKVNKLPTIYASALIVLLFALVVAYMYFLSMSVVHVVLRKELRQEEHHLRSEIARLEAEYIEAQHGVSEKIANVDAFSETNDKIFVHRVPPTLVLSVPAQ